METITKTQWCLSHQWLYCKTVLKLWLTLIFNFFTLNLLNILLNTFLTTNFKIMSILVRNIYYESYLSIEILRKCYVPQNVESRYPYVWGCNYENKFDKGYTSNERLRTTVLDICHDWLVNNILWFRIWSHLQNKKKKNIEVILAIING